jgi:hypothetical protein
MNTGVVNSTELTVTTPTELVHPTSGELVSLDSDADVAAFLDDAKEIQSQVREATAIATRVVLERMDRRASWTVREGPYELKGDGPGNVTYDGDALAHALADLVDRGLISEEAALAACEATVVRKPKVRGINALKKLGGEIQAAMERLAEPVPDAKRRVSVKRGGR